MAGEEMRTYRAVEFVADARLQGAVGHFVVWNRNEAIGTDGITDAMIAAGVDEFWEHDVEEEGSRVVLTAVYLAMERARSQGSPKES